MSTTSASVSEVGDQQQEQRSKQREEQSLPTSFVSLQRENSLREGLALAHKLQSKCAATPVRSKLRSWKLTLKDNKTFYKGVKKRWKITSILTTRWRLFKKIELQNWESFVHQKNEYSPTKRKRDYTKRQADTCTIKSNSKSAKHDSSKEIQTRPWAVLNDNGSPSIPPEPIAAPSAAPISASPAVDEHIAKNRKSTHGVVNAVVNGVAESNEKPKSATKVDIALPHTEQGSKPDNLAIAEDGDSSSGPNKGNTTDHQINQDKKDDHDIYIDEVLVPWRQQKWQELMRIEEQERSSGRTNKRQRDALESWYQHFQRYCFHVQNNGGNIPQGNPFGTWVNKLRRQNVLSDDNKERNHRFLSAERRELLEQIGFDWGERKDKWEDRFAELLEFRKEHGHCE